MKKLIITTGILISLLICSQTLMAASYFTRHTLNDATATTTSVFMTPGTATSTITFSSSDVDLAGLFINLRASTSASILNWKYQYSNNNIDWYDEDVRDNTFNINLSTPLGDINHSSSSPTHLWTPGNTTSSTTRKMLILPDFISGWTRIVFSLPIGTVNSTLYAEVVAKRNAQ